MVMIWLIRILFDGKLRQREIRHRRALILQNQVFLQELEKVRKQFSSFTQEELEKDLYLQGIKNLRLKDFIEKIKALNAVTNILFISRSHIDKIEKFVSTFKEFFHHIVDRANLYRKLDGFNQKDSINEKVIKRLSHLHTDGFVTS